MLGYAVKRVALAIPTILVVLFIVFALGYYGPLDPVKLEVRSLRNQQIYLTDEEIATLRHSWGLDRPLLVQFGDYIKNLVLHGSLGEAYTSRESVLRLILFTLPVSGQIALGAAVMIVFVGVPLGALAAKFHNTWPDYAIVGTSLFLRSVPIFVLAPMFLILLVLKLDVMDVPRGYKGFTNPTTFLFVFLLALNPLAVVIRQTRAGILEVLGNDYVRTAHAKGLTEWIVLTRHVLRNALIPVVTSTGLIVSGLITGSVFLDQMFNIPGFGRLFSGALSGRDFYVIYGSVIVVAIITTTTNLIVDLLYPVLDPRVTYG